MVYIVDKTKMRPETVLLTAGNRGIGLEFVQQLLKAEPKKLIVTCRDFTKAEELVLLAKANSNVTLLEFDLLKDLEDDKLSAFVEKVEKALDGAGLNLVINNAGLLEREPIDLEHVMRVFQVNACGPLLLSRALMPLVKKAAAGSPGDLSLSRAGFVNISSKVGSIDDNKKGGNYLYRGAKCALNMFNKTLSLEYGEDVLFVLLHPGWVKTDMGGPNALITAEESVTGMMKVMSGITAKDQAHFYDFAGKEIPW